MKFSSDHDELTIQQHAYGQGLMNQLRQEKHHPLKQHEQIILLVSALNHVMQDIPTKKIGEFKEGLLRFFEEQAPHISQELNNTGVLSNELKEDIVKYAREYLSKAMQA